MKKAHTSIRAWREYKGSRSHIAKKEKVYQFIKSNDLCTGREISASIAGGWKRVSELLNEGRIRRAGIRQATRRGGRAAYTYSANATQIKMLIQKDKPWKLMYHEQVKENMVLREKINNLRRGLDL